MNKVQFNISQHLCWRYFALYVGKLCNSLIHDSIVISTPDNDPNEICSKISGQYYLVSKQITKCAHMMKWFGNDL